MIETVKNIGAVKERFQTIRGDDAMDLSRKLNHLGFDFSLKAVSMDLDSRPFAIIELNFAETKKQPLKKLGA